LVPQFPFELHVPFDEQPPFVPHDPFSAFVQEGQHPLHSFFGAVAHPVTSPDIAAMRMNAFALVFIGIG
jgi:hypothetical protein